MSDSTSHPTPAAVTPPRFGTGFWFVFGLLIFLLGAVATIILRNQMGGTDAYEQERAKKRIEARLKIEEEAKKLLHEPGWSDQAKGTVRIPLEDAMALEIATLKQKQPRAAYAVGAAVPIPASATAAPAPAKPATPAPAPAAGQKPAPASATNSTPAPASQPQPAPKK